MNKLFQTITCSNDDVPQYAEQLNPKVKNTSKLIIRDMVLKASIGVNPEEKISPQDVIISVEAELCETPHTSNDDINDVLSYDNIVQAIKSLTKERHINLVETLAEDIAQEVLSLKAVSVCKISVEKPDIYDDIGRVGVEITRYRETLY